MKKHTISSEIDRADVAIENTLQYDRILKKLAVYNYDRKRMMEGKGLKEEVKMLELTKQDKYGKQFETSDALKVQTTEVKTRYYQHAKRAKMAFEGQRGTLEQLQLQGKRKTDHTGLLSQIHTFYSKIDGFTEAMARYDISPEELAQTKAMVEALYAVRQQQLICRGDAQDATQKRDTKRKELRQWMSKFKKVARVALSDEPQLLEMLGIMVPTQKV